MKKVVSFLGAYHDVPTNPSNNSTYIDVQVVDILNEILDGEPLSPHVEGMPIAPAISCPVERTAYQLGVSLAAFREMMDRIWEVHKRLEPAALRVSYQLKRTVEGVTLTVTWKAQSRYFIVERRV